MDQNGTNNSTGSKESEGFKRHVTHLGLKLKSPATTSGWPRATKEQNLKSMLVWMVITCGAQNIHGIWYVATLNSGLLGCTLDAAAVAA